VDPNEKSMKKAMIGNRDDLHRFFRHIVLNNSIQIKTKQDGSIEMSSSSPDEEALVKGAAYYGYKLISVLVLIFFDAL
jgi:magnesium-transporting ATPase (P-type)